MKISIIKVNGKISNLYVNSGNYVRTVAEEIKRTIPNSHVQIETMTTSINQESLEKLLKLYCTIPEVEDVKNLS